MFKILLHGKPFQATTYETIQDAEREIEIHRDGCTYPPDLEDFEIALALNSYCCQSVVGGWQTFDNESKRLVGPSFHSIANLWKWQKSNIR